jgi:hypothetical protein
MMFAACLTRSDNTRKEGTSRALMDLAKVALSISIFEESSLKYARQVSRIVVHVPRFAAQTNAEKTA